MTITIYFYTNPQTYNFEITQDDGVNLKGFYVKGGKKHYVRAVRTSMMNINNKIVSYIKALGKYECLAVLNN
jgi:hypothetical protein